MGRATFSLIINQTESKAKTPTVDNGFLIPGYPSSKLRAEKIVLGAYGATLANGVGMYIYNTCVCLCVMYLCVCDWVAMRMPRVYERGKFDSILYATNQFQFFPVLLFINQRSDNDDTILFCR